VRAAKKAAKDQAAKDAIIAAMGGAASPSQEEVRTPGYGKRNVQSVLDQIAAERGVDRHAPPAALGEATAQFDDEMATPVAPRAKGVPAASAGPGIADLQMELRLWWKGKTVAERAAMLKGLEGGLDAAWNAATDGEQGRFMKARWVESAPPDVDAAADAIGTRRPYGSRVNLALVEQSARVKRKTRDADVLRLCEMIEGRL
jgi:hypothetical protein